MDSTHRRPSSDSKTTSEVQQGPDDSWDELGTYKEGARLTPEQHSGWRRTWEPEPLSVAEDWDMRLERARWEQRQGDGESFQGRPRRSIVSPEQYAMFASSPA